MAREFHTRISLLSMLAPALFGCTSCIYVGDFSTMARYEKEVLLSASLEPGSSFSANTGDGSITIR